MRAGDHRTLILFEVPAPQVRGDDELHERAATVPFAGARGQPELRAGAQAVAAVDNFALVRSDGFEPAVLADIGDERRELRLSPTAWS